jgi:two-component system response regulator HydG
VRELRNAVENMVVLAGGDVLDVGDLPYTLDESGGQRLGATGYALAGRSLAEVERALIEENLALMEGNREKTARVLGMGERTLYRKLKEYGLG